MSRPGLLEAVEELVEEGCSVGLALFAGVVSLAGEGGFELDAGLEVAAGFAGGFHAAIEFDGSGAQAVAEHAGVGFFAQSDHAGGFVVGGNGGFLAVEGVDLALTAWYSSATTRLAMRA